MGGNRRQRVPGAMRRTARTTSLLPAGKPTACGVLVLLSKQNQDSGEAASAIGNTPHLPA
jgi:hypothetical protein